MRIAGKLEAAKGGTTKAGTARRGDGTRKPLAGKSAGGGTRKTRTGG